MVLCIITVRRMVIFQREGGSNVVPVVASQQTTPVLAGNELLLRSRVKKETSLREELFSKAS